MKRAVVPIMTIAWLTAVVAPLDTPPLDASERARIDWHDRVDVAWQAVHAQRPLLLFLTLEGCSYCRKMDQNTFCDPQVVTEVGQCFVPAKIEGTQEPQLVKRLGVRIYPTTVIISHTAQVLDAIPGYLPAEQLRLRLSSAARKVKPAEPAP